jgi:hypothetical protein
MATKILSVKPDGPQGRFSTAPTLLIARQIGSNDAASAASRRKRRKLQVRGAHPRAARAVRERAAGRAGCLPEGAGGPRLSRRVRGTMHGLRARAGWPRAKHKPGENYSGQPQGQQPAERHRRIPLASHRGPFSGSQPREPFFFRFSFHYFGEVPVCAHRCGRPGARRERAWCSQALAGRDRDGAALLLRAGP